VPFGDVRSLSQAIRLLIENHSLRKQLGEAGYRRVVSYYTWDRAYARIREIYARLARK
jgi:glycosyltransferase involved in cell wall biosynthesis